MITIYGENYVDADDYISIQLSRTFGFKRNLAQLISKFGFDHTTGISDDLLADFLYNQMIHLSLTVSKINKEKNEAFTITTHS